MAKDYVEAVKWYRKAAEQNIAEAQFSLGICFTQALRRVMRPTIRSLFEPHYKQNLYANPKRTAKSLLALHYMIQHRPLLVQIIFLPVES